MKKVLKSARTPCIILGRRRGGVNGQTNAAYRLGMNYIVYGLTQ